MPAFYCNKQKIPIFTISIICRKKLESKGDFITVKPKDAQLAKHIAYYYFHTSDDPGFHKKFSFYPNYNHALTFYKDSEVTLTGTNSVVRLMPGRHCCLYSINTDKNYSVDIRGPFFKTGIVFNPLGINHFIKEPLSGLFNHPVGEFGYFRAGLEDLSDGLYIEADANKRAEILDRFFRSAYVGFEEPEIKRALQEILNSNGSVKVEELSDGLGLNRKTLLRLFKKHLCCSVEEYKKMVMFRNALNYSQQEGSSLSLTDVALYSLYYDQAHFIKHFKSVTQLPPKVLLTRLTKLGNQDVYWNFED